MTGRQHRYAPCLPPVTGTCAPPPSDEAPHRRSGASHHQGRSGDHCRRRGGGFDRHELLAAVAGLRTLSRVRESEGSLDSDDEDLLDEVFGRQKEE